MVQLLIPIIYLSFISLGLPDSLLGAAWPTMYGEMSVPLSYAGILSMIIAGGTILSSLLSDRVTRRLGAGRVTAISVGVTAAALLGFSFSHSFWVLCLLAIPYGLGAGSVDAALNNYVALHYSARHMSWLHCMWGLGTVIGPNIMSYALTGGMSWQSGYRYVSYLQMGLTLLLVLTLPLWKQKAAESRLSALTEGASAAPALSLKEIMRIPGAKAVMLTFFCYCAAESTAILWVSSYMHLQNGIDSDTAAGYGSIFLIGITVGRFLSGLISEKLSDTKLIRLGLGLILVGISVIFLPFGELSAVIGIVIFGLGCAPIYPCIIHSTPRHFGADKSQAVIGVQMASAYVGSCFMPPVFGLIARHIHVGWLPVYLLAFALLMILSHELLVKQTAHTEA